MNAHAERFNRTIQEPVAQTVTSSFQDDKNPS